MEKTLERKDRCYGYVVEGKTDEDKLKKLGIKLIVKTNGKFIAKTTLAFIAEVSRVRPLVFALDPDRPGIAIRRKLEDYLPDKDFRHIETGMKEATDGRKFGVAQMHMDRLAEVLAPFREHDENSPETFALSAADLLALGLSGRGDSRARRQKLEAQLGVSFPDGKTLLTGLWLLGFSKAKVEEVLADGHA